MVTSAEKKEALRPKFVVECITGNTKERQTVVDRYNEGAIHLLFLTDAAHQSCDLKGKNTVAMSLTEKQRALFDEQQTVNRVVRFESKGRIRFVDIDHYISIFPTHPPNEAQSRELQEDYEQRHCRGEPAGFNVGQVLWDMIQGRSVAQKAAVDADDNNDDDDDAGDTTTTTSTEKNVAPDDEEEEEEEEEKNEERKEEKKKKKKTDKRGAREKEEEDEEGEKKKNGTEEKKNNNKRKKTKEKNQGDEGRFLHARSVPPPPVGAMETVDLKFDRLAKYHYEHLMPWVRCFHRVSPFYKDRERERARQIALAEKEDAAALVRSSTKKKKKKDVATATTRTTKPRSSSSSSSSSSFSQSSKEKK